MCSRSLKATIFSSSFERNERLDIGLLFLIDSLSKWLFFRIGVMTAIFMESGIPSQRHLLMTHVISGVRIGAQSLTSLVGKGSSRQDLEGDPLSSLATSSFFAGLKVESVKSAVGISSDLELSVSVVSDISSSVLRRA